MKITIPKKFDKITNDEIREALRFGGAMMLTPAMVSQIEIRVVHMSALDCKQHDGSVTPYKVDRTVSRNPRKFVLEINPNSSKKMARLTVFHEWTHIKQYARGELLMDKTGSATWKKKAIKINTPYWNLPHEIEAHGMQNILESMFVQWKKQKKSSKI